MIGGDRFVLSFCFLRVCLVCFVSRIGVLRDVSVWSLMKVMWEGGEGELV